MPIYTGGTALAVAGSRALSSIDQTIGNRDEIQARAAEAKLRKNTAEAQDDPDTIKNQVAALDAQNQQLINTQAKRDTTDAFRLYIKTGNPNHLTDLFKNNKKVRDQFRGISTISKLDPTTDQRLLTENGISLEDFRPGRHLKATMPDGTTKLFDAFDVATGTGALLAVMNEELDLANKWIKAQGKDGRGYAPGGLEKDSVYAGNTIANLSEQEAATQLFDKRVAGLEPGKQEKADEALTELTDAFGGDEEFFKTDFGLRKNQILAARSLRKYRALGGIDLTSKQKSDVVDLSKLIGLANIAESKLTPEVTGVYDTFLRSVRSYITDNVDEVDKIAAQSAYEAFRATFRLALSGTALTDNEIKLFNNAYGTIRQKYPAVAAQFKTLLSEVKFKLEAIENLNDPYLAYYYLGNKVSTVDNIIGRLDERLELISQAQGNEPGQFADRTREGTGDDLKVIENQNQISPEDAFNGISPKQVTDSLNEIWGK